MIWCEIKLASETVLTFISAFGFQIQPGASVKKSVSLPDSRRVTLSLSLRRSLTGGEVTPTNVSSCGHSSRVVVKIYNSRQISTLDKREIWLCLPSLAVIRRYNNPTMSHRYEFPRKPVANPKAIVQGEKYRLTVLTEGVLRYEWAEDGQFEDRASTFALFRDLPVPDLKVTETDDYVEITTDLMSVYYKYVRAQTARTPV